MVIYRKSSLMPLLDTQSGDLDFVTLGRLSLVMFSVFVAPCLSSSFLVDAKLMKWNRFQYRNIRVHPLSNVASWVVPNALTCFLFADVKRSASTAQDSELTRVASANEEWKSSEDRNLWLDTLAEDFVTSDEDQNDLDESNVSSHGNTFFKSWITVFLVSVFCSSTLNYAWNIMCQKQFGQLIRH